MKKLVLSLAMSLCVAGCSDDGGSTTPSATDTGTSNADTGATPADTGTTTDTAIADSGADTGPTVSSDGNTPTPLAIGMEVTTTLAADGEHFFEYTPSEAGDHTLHFTSPNVAWYANHSTMKNTHFCGPPRCVTGTGTATLPALAAGTTYYLNIYNGTKASGSYTIKVTKP